MTCTRTEQQTKQNRTRQSSSVRRNKQKAERDQEKGFRKTNMHFMVHQTRKHTLTVLIEQRKSGSTSQKFGCSPPSPDSSMLFNSLGPVLSQKSKVKSQKFIDKAQCEHGIQDKTV